MPGSIIDCRPGFILKNGACLPACGPNERLGANGKCFPLLTLPPRTLAPVLNNIAPVCTGGQILVGSTCKCPGGQELVKGSCTAKCDRGQTRNPAGVCVAAPAGGTLQPFIRKLP